MSVYKFTFAYGINNTNKQTQPFLQIYAGSFYSGQGGTSKHMMKATSGNKDNIFVITPSTTQLIKSVNFVESIVKK